MAASDAKPVPIRGQPYRAFFWLWKADGTLAVGAAGLAAVVSKDGAAGAGTASAPVESQMPGQYYVELTGPEMTAHHVGGLVTSTTAGVLPGPINLYTTGSGDIPVNAAQVGGQTASAAGPVTFPGSVGTSTYAGADTAGVTTLLARVTGAVPLAADYTPARAARLDRLPTAGTVAVAGDAMALAAGVVTDASFTLPPEGSRTGVLGLVRWAARRLGAARVVNDIAGGQIRTYRPDGTTVDTTQTYTASDSAEDVGAAT